MKLNPQLFSTNGLVQNYTFLLRYFIFFLTQQSLSFFCCLKNGKQQLSPHHTPFVG